jgi:hypothetical protein
MVEEVGPSGCKTEDLYPFVEIIYPPVLIVAAERACFCPRMKQRRSAVIPY